MSEGAEKYTSSQTPLGNYKYLVMPFGILTALEVFKREATKI
jgi:hypothetical protein